MIFRPPLHGQIFRFAWLCGLALMGLRGWAVAAGPVTQPGNAASSTRNRPAYNWLKVDLHVQRYQKSCIPSSVEIVLKLLNRVPLNYFELQDAWKNKTDGNFSDFDGRAIAGVTFRKQFGMPRSDDFPLDDLFKTIDSELSQGRYVIISLASAGGWHMYVIVAPTPFGDYRAVSKDGDTTLELVRVKPRVKAMKGTDILTYTVAAPPPGPSTRPLSSKD